MAKPKRKTSKRYPRSTSAKKLGKKTQKRTKQPVKKTSKTQLPEVMIAPSTPLKSLLGYIAFLAVVAISLYLGSVNHDFAYDDMSVVKNNRFIQQGIDGFGNILKTQYFAGYNPDMNAMAYRPVSLLSYAVEHELFGMDPQVFHIGNILLYGITAIFLFLALQQLLYKHHVFLAFAISLLFIAHPIHVDVVANIKSRDEIWGFLNFSIAFWLFLKYVDQRKVGVLITSLVFYGLALASKESYLTTLAVLPLLLYFFRDLSIKQIVRITLPYALVFVGFLLLRYSIIGTDNPTSPIRYIDNPLLAAKNLNERIGSNILVMGMNLKSLIIPYQLVSDYSYNSIPLEGMGNWKVLLSLLAYAALIGMTAVGVKRKSPYAFAFLYFFATISIVSSIFIMSSNAYADRFLYLPSLSLCLALGFLLFRNTEKAKEMSLLDFLKVNKIAVLILVVVVGLYSYRTIMHVPVWKNNFTLFSYIAEEIPQNARIRKSLGGEYYRMASAAKDDPAKQKELALKAIKELEAGLAIYDRQTTGHTHLGNSYILLKDYTKAEEALKNSLRIFNRDRYAKSSLGYVYYVTGRYVEAADTWESIATSQRNKNDYYNLYLAYNRLGDREKADYYRKLSGR